MYGDDSPKLPKRLPPSLVGPSLGELVDEPVTPAHLRVERTLGCSRDVATPAHAQIPGPAVDRIEERGRQVYGRCTVVLTQTE